MRFVAIANFVGIHAICSIFIEPWNATTPEDEDEYKQLMQLKPKHPHLKVILRRQELAHILCIIRNAPICFDYIVCFLFHPSQIMMFMPFYYIDQYYGNPVKYRESIKNATDFLVRFDFDGLDLIDDGVFKKFVEDFSHSKVIFVLFEVTIKIINELFFVQICCAV